MAVTGGELTISAPTASDSGERGVSAIDAAFARLPHDPGRYVPNTTTIRFAKPMRYVMWMSSQSSQAMNPPWRPNGPSQPMLVTPASRPITATSPLSE